MALYNISGVPINSIYGIAGNPITNVYNINGISIQTIISEKYSIQNIATYFRNSVELIENKINALSTDDWESFIFITDIHGNGNKQHSQAIALYLLDNTNCSMIVLGGDYSLSSWNKTEFEKYMDVFKNSGLSRNIYALFGNHETYPGGAGTAEAKSQIYKYFLNNKIQTIGSLANIYYYIDNYDKKIRYMFLNTSDGDSQYIMSNTQIEWIQNNVILPDNTWSLLVFGHVNLNNFDITSNTMTTSTEGNAANIISAINNCNGTIIGYICGHQHIDVTKKVGNFQHTTLQCDKLETIDYYNGISFIDRSIGNITEQAVSIISINQKTKQVIIRRVGAARNYNTRIDGENDNSIVMSYSYA